MTLQPWDPAALHPRTTELSQLQACALPVPLPYSSLGPGTLSAAVPPLGTRGRCRQNSG